jgi:hypothetical protein
VEHLARVYNRMLEEMETRIVEMNLGDEDDSATAPIVFSLLEEEQQICSVVMHELVCQVRTHTRDWPETVSHLGGWGDRSPYSVQNADS